MHNWEHMKDNLNSGYIGEIRSLETLHTYERREKYGRRTTTSRRESEQGLRYFHIHPVVSRLCASIYGTSPDSLVLHPFKFEEILWLMDVLIFYQGIYGFERI
ncbi:unnamed protein product [Lactuca virosa]|uniref:Uncharacterized protein n=1 Tax=Lactuca virosa TaxID=75947 RepID=A0AAU9PB64_9ASTR|nr:unnamed protein product [Lactuca virosa]